MEVTKKHLRELERVHTNLSRAIAYIQRPNVQGIAVETTNPNGGSYRIVNPDLALPNDHTIPRAEFIQTINHEVGSDFVGLYQAFRELDRIIKALQD